MTDTAASNPKNKKPDDLKIIKFGDPLYHYARAISNTRFGHMPYSIAYCQTVEHVQYCIHQCKEHELAFRVRSGGHQHEGMCSGNNVMIIDLSEMNTIEYVENDQAWIPVGIQLQKAYGQLEDRSRIIPGGGCQSVNVGGITQGCGWGLYIRKLGMTCDNILECEVVLADGSVVLASPSNEPDLFHALKGGGGGNFGVVTKFKFQLHKLAPKMTSFALLWEAPVDAKQIVKLWANLHVDPYKLDTNLSTFCSMGVAKPGGNELIKGHVSAVHSRMGGTFFGSKDDLIALLKKHFGGLIPEESGFVELNEKEYDKGKKTLLESHYESDSSHTWHQARVADFINPTGAVGYHPGTSSCPDRNYRVLADAPTSTCDKPHPHKVTSSFPKAHNEKEHDALVDEIYNYLAGTCYYSDVNRYMSFHCLGGAVTENTGGRIFPYHNKPYLLQIQCWWNDAGNAFTNEARNKVYVKWVEDFRKHILPVTEGSFINFVDRYLVEDPETPKGRLALLEIYYGKENLHILRGIKREYDPHNMFDFEMSIPPAH